MTEWLPSLAGSLVGGIVGGAFVALAATIMFRRANNPRG